LTLVTNVTVSFVTNQSITVSTTELAGPPDFTPVPTGESLVLLVDGARHGLSATNVQTGFVTRRGFTTAFYHVPSQLIADIAKAGEVLIRLRGVNGVVEKR
jgi:hypothetical protein